MFYPNLLASNSINSVFEQQNPIPKSVERMQKEIQRDALRGIKDSQMNDKTVYKTDIKIQKNANSLEVQFKNCL